VEIYYIIALVIAIVTHEVSHGYIAYMCGDPTAKQAGRLTLNPIRHIDPFGSVILPGLLLLSHLPPFGYAKPVPVNVQRLRSPRNQSVLVAIAGPLVNGFWVIVAVIIGHLSGCHWTSYCTPVQSDVAKFAVAFAIVNASLGAFNLLPVPPLDGSAFIERLVPASKLRAYFTFRSLALPLAMVFFVVDGMTLHLTDHVLNWVQTQVQQIVLPN
jgi:Zn-dependent protease